MKTTLCDRCKVPTDKPIILTVTRSKTATYELCDSCYNVFNKLIERKLTLFDLNFFKEKKPKEATI